MNKNFKMLLAVLLGVALAFLLEPRLDRIFRELSEAVRSDPISTAITTKPGRQIEFTRSVAFIYPYDIIKVNPLFYRFSEDDILDISERAKIMLPKGWVLQDYSVVFTSSKVWFLCRDHGLIKDGFHSVNGVEVTVTASIYIPPEAKRGYSYPIILYMPHYDRLLLRETREPDIYPPLHSYTRVMGFNNAKFSDLRSNEVLLLVKVR